MALVAHPALRRGRALRQGGRRSTPPTIEPQVTWGTEPAGRAADHRRGARPQTAATMRGRRRGHGALARVHGPRARHADGPRSRSTRCSSAPAPTAASRTCAPPPRWSRGRKVAPERARHGRARLGPGEAPGRGGGPGPDLHRRRLRVARGRLLDVPRHEPGPAQARRALRLHHQPQLRGPPGQGRPHAPDVARHGGRRGARRPAGRRARLAAEGETGDASLHHPHRGRRAAADGERGHGQDHPGALPEVDQPQRLRQAPLRQHALPRGRVREPRLRAEPAALPRRAGADRLREFRLRLARASTRPGRCSTSASAASSPPTSPTSSTTTASRTASCRCACRARSARS